MDQEVYMDKYELRNTLSLEIPFSQLFTFNVLNEEQLSETNRWISAPEGTVLNHFQLGKATGKKTIRIKEEEL